MAKEQLILREEDKKNAEELKEFFKKKETQSVIGELLIQFQSIFGYQWFTLDDCIKIFKTHKVEQIIDIIKTLYLCGFLIENSKKSGILDRYRLSTNAIAKLTEFVDEK